jgi:hypothetical protein
MSIYKEILHILYKYARGLLLTFLLLHVPSYFSEYGPDSEQAVYGKFVCGILWPIIIPIISLLVVIHKQTFYSIVMRLLFMCFWAMLIIY